MFGEHANRLFFYVREGGFVTACLVASMFVLWGALGFRLTTLKRGTRHSVRRLVTMGERGEPLPRTGLLPVAVREALVVARSRPYALRERLELEFHARFDGDMGRFSMLVKSLVVVAPLTGLLGTVSGMMETFASLDGGTFQAQSGGIAGGIAEALIATQLGLAVAIPGLLVGRILQRREETLRDELREVRDLVSARFAVATGDS